MTGTLPNGYAESEKNEPWAGHRLMFKLPPSGSDPMAVSLCLRRGLTTPCAWLCGADIILASGTIHRLVKPGASVAPTTSDTSFDPVYIAASWFPCLGRRYAFHTAISLTILPYPTLRSNGRGSLGAIRSINDGQVR